VPVSPDFGTNPTGYKSTPFTLKADETPAPETELRQSKYPNNGIEPDHRNIKRLTNPMMGFGSFNTARRTLRGIEAMRMIRKGQVKGIRQGDSVSQAKFIEELFGKRKLRRFPCETEP
jgi:transposase-like protein